jgi:putative tryptophan/tyrosine transport system substrate-binding protein
MRRRNFVALLSLAAIVRPRVVTAQLPGRTRRIGLLYPSGKDDPSMVAADIAFKSELGRLGWKDGENLRIDERWTIPDANHLRVLATELVDLGPDAIFVIGALGTKMLREATRTVPIVFDNVADPVEQGLVSTFARPGSNVTGFTNVDFSMGSKWVEMIKVVSPQVSRVALIFNPDTAPYVRYFEPSLSAAARELALDIAQEPVHNAAEIDGVIRALSAESGASLIVSGDTFTYRHRERIAELALQAHLPTVYLWKEGAVSGGLMSYGCDNVDLVRRAASYVDRILMGASPRDLPVQQPTKFELVINLRTARALGLTIPRSLLARADEVIE